MLRQAVRYSILPTAMQVFSNAPSTASWLAGSLCSAVQGPRRSLVHHSSSPCACPPELGPETPPNTWTPPGSPVRYEEPAVQDHRACVQNPHSLRIGFEPRQLLLKLCIAQRVLLFEILLVTLLGLPAPGD